MASGGTNVGGVSVSVSLSIDQAMRELDKLEKKIQKAFAGMSTTGKVGTGLSRFNEDLKDTTPAVDRVTHSMGGLNKTSKGLGKSLGQLGNAAILAPRNPLMAASQGASALNMALGGIAGSGGIAAGALVGVGVAAATAAIALIAVSVGVFKLGKMGFGASRELEVLNLSMEAITGSAAAAKDEVAALQNIAIASPFLTTTIVNLDKFLISQGVASAKLRSGLVDATLNLSAALGLADDNIGSITYALAQVQARGYLSGDEMRQLANQFIPVMEALKTMPEYATMSTGAIRKMIEQGQISSTQFFEALIAYTEKYDGIAARASLTVDGLINKLEDVSRIRIGQAFIDMDNLAAAVSPLEVIRDLLASVVGMIEQIDWRPFAAAVGELTNVFVGPVTDFFSGGTGDAMVRFFTEWLPQGIIMTAKVLLYVKEVFIAFMKIMFTFVYAIGDAFNAIIDLFRSFGITWSQFFMALGAMVAYTVVGLAAMFAVMVSGIGIAAGSVQFLMNAIVALILVMRFDFAGAAGAWNRAVTGMQHIVTGFGNAAKAIPTTIKSTVSAANDLVNAFRRIQKIKLPQLPELDQLGKFAEVASNVSGGLPADGGGGGTGAAAKSVDELAKLMDMLWDLTRRWRGMRSELEKGFLGKDGFEATVDQIWAMGRKLDEAFQGLGRTDVADWIYDQTVELVKLAEKRDELTKKLKDATANLNDLVKERDKFAASLRSSAIKFAAAMKVEYESVRTFEQVSDRGFFIESEERKAKSLVDTLKERADALKRYYENIKQLKDSGLDATLLEDLITAGPEASGETAAALVEGGKEMIDSVNVIYKDIEKTADLIGEFGAEEFHQAGIDQAQALVDGLTADLAAVTEQAELITAEIYSVVEPFAKEMEDQGAKASKGMANGLSSGIPAVSSSMGGIAAAVGNGWAQMDEDARLGATDMLDTFRLELKYPMIEDILEMGDKMVDVIDQTVFKMNVILDRLKLPDLDLSSALATPWTKLKEIADRLRKDWKSVIRMALFDVPFAAWQFVPGLKSVYNWATNRSMDTNTSGASAVNGAAFAINAVSAGAVGSTAYFGTQPDNYSSAPIVKVFIGDQELRGIVRTEVIYNDRMETSRVISGRRV